MMKLSDVLSEDLIYIDLRARRKKKALQEVIKFLSKRRCVLDSQKLLNAILAREEIRSTGIGCGIGIPHGITDAVRDLTCALAVSKKGVKYGSIDKEPVHLIFVVISPEMRNIHYLAVLASICRAFDDERLRNAVINATSAAEVMDIIREAEEAENRK
jgi:mannitol/fructose-specific phosphotransferase system IIA component (Ntr-type)